MMKRRFLPIGLAVAMAGLLFVVYGQSESSKPEERVMRIEKLKPSDTRLFPQILGDKKIKSGGLYVFKPGETAHPEPRHVHDVDEVFIFVQGRGVLPIDGVEYPVKTGDVVIVKGGEDHHTRSSVEDPLVAAWYIMEE
ncbi:MAG: cupin domain-containing protein [bacterium]|jgi:mannose-6-phosphate isomerase-like protein (cupin superfamily)|nr:cupin domain-containing protein [bacterium]